MNSYPVLTVKRKSEFNVKISNDICMNCDVTCICSLPSGHVSVADRCNQNVKLFDKYYNVSSHCNVSDFSQDICQITPSEVAVSLRDADVQFMSVSNGQLVNVRKLQLPLASVSISHHKGALYIASGQALYPSTLTGTGLKKLYTDTKGGSTVFRCAVSPAGDRNYVTNYSQHKLLTLATDVSLISTFTDPELQGPHDVHVTPEGQVLVCGLNSKTVIQVDREGKKKLATLASWKDGVSKPVCCNTNNHQIIVRLFENNKIIVMELQ